MEVFFLAFANDPAHPLPHLETEADIVYDYAWKKARDRNFIPFYSPFATVEKVNEKLIHCKGLVSLFLYSGHAWGEQLGFEGGKGSTKGIGMHLTKTNLTTTIEAAGPKVVILNACGTVDAAKALLAMGVQVVIATQAAIQDKSASEFAKGFFQSLCQHESTILEAYVNGLAAAQTADNSLDLRASAVVRGPAYLEEHEDGKPLWGIFTQNERLASQRLIPKLNDSLFQFRTNEKLLKTIYTSFYNAGNRAVVSLWNQEHPANPEDLWDVNPVEKENAICDSIPMPIGIQLLTLLKSQSIRKKRTSEDLVQLTQVFHSTIEFLGFIMVAQLWEVELKCDTEAKLKCDAEAKLKCGILKISDDLKSNLRKFFYQTSQERNLYDYSRLIFAITDCLSHPGQHVAVQTFLQEQTIFTDISKIDQTNFLSASDNLLLIRRRSMEQLPDIDVQQLYYEAEDVLSELIAMLAFIHKYKLSSIHHIETLKKRHQNKTQARFRHDTYALSQTRPYSKFVTLDHYMDSFGLVIIVNEPKDKIADFLNIAPFIVDIHASDRGFETSAIKFFDEWIEGFACQFKDVENPTDKMKKEQLSKTDPKFAHVLEELEAFINTFLINTQAIS